MTRHLLPLQLIYCDYLANHSNAIRGSTPVVTASSPEKQQLLKFQHLAFLPVSFARPQYYYGVGLRLRSKSQSVAFATGLGEIMKLRTVLALGALTTLASTSFGFVWYDNGGPDGSGNGNEMSHWTQSEDVPFDAGNSFDRLVFWTLEASSAVLSTVSINFSFDDGSGNPGVIAASFLNTALTSHTATGNVFGGLTEYMVVVDFASVGESGSGFFHMDLLANEATNPNFDRQEIYWASTNANATGFGRESEFNARNNWANNGVEHAFRLENTLVPEPASFAVLGLGALVLLRRRRK